MLNNLDIIKEIPLISFDNYDVQTFFYFDFPNSENFFKLKIITPKGIYQSEVAREIWINEVRQLNKLKSVTHADKYLELVQDSFVEENSFCLIYFAKDSQTILSETVYELRSRQFSRSWLHPKNILKINNRLVLWKNILRIIEGIKILHSQHIVHRNIRLESILFDSDNNLDDDERLILSGFEKSLDFERLSNATIMQENDNVVFSTSEDWYQLGLLILSLLGLTEDNYISSQLTHDEEKFIETLLKVKSNFASKLIASEDIAKSVNFLIERLNTLTVAFHKTNYVTMPSTNYKSFPNLKEKVRHLVKDENGNILEPEIFTHSIFYQFIKLDLEDAEIELFKNKSNSYIVKGKQCFYEIRRHNVNKQSDSLFSVFSDWNVAEIKSIYTSFPEWLNHKQKIKIRNKIEFVDFNRLYAGNYRFEISSDNSWKTYFNAFEKENEFTDDEIGVLQAFLLIFAIEAARQAAETYLVSIEETSKEYRKRHNLDQYETTYLIRYDESKDTQNLKLSKILKINKPLERFGQELESDKPANTWYIEPIDATKEDLNKYELEIVKYIGQGELIVSSKSNLRALLPSYGKDDVLFSFYHQDYIGTQALLKRKLQIFMKLMEHTLLLQSLSQPGDSVTVTRRNFDVDKILNKFDDSKKTVFTHLIKTQPNFVIGGPPGVGKTFLISNYVNHLFQEENNTKVILSAQAHATVKNLHYNVIKNIINENFYKDLIIVEYFKEDATDKSLDSKNDDEESSILFKTSERYLKDFEKSELFRSNTNNLAIRTKLKEFIKTSHWSFFSQILKSANLVFTTSNSALMASLVRNDIAFDVSIMEESAKASGLELIGPMMIANKRVLIGDHKQLPPFDENMVKRVISNDDGISASFLISILENLGLSSNIKNSLNLRNIDDQFDENLTRNIYKYFSLFETLSKTAKSLSSLGQNSFGKSLDIQHRMHPEICEIVSNTVYEGQLNTHHDHIEHCKETIPFYFEKSNLIDLNSDRAVVWVDIPDKQWGEKLPAFEKDYANKTELCIIKEILNNLRCRPRTEPYSIRILSPYVNQVNLINREISNKELPKDFIVEDNKSLACTIDSFQGNEADIIIVSLVRHNGNATIGSALGFLSDMRRMNVMLSRAVYKMVIVGCFELFSCWQDIIKDKSSLLAVDLEFLGKFVEFCKPDFKRMKETPIDNHTKAYTKIGFVSAVNFLGNNDE